MTKIRIGLFVLFFSVFLVGIGMIPQLTTSTASAHVAISRNVHGDYLRVQHEGRACVYTVHFTLSRGMGYARHYRVTGPGAPHLIFVGRGQAIAVYNTPRSNRCQPDRFHRARQFDLIAY